MDRDERRKAIKFDRNGAQVCDMLSADPETAISSERRLGFFRDSGWEKGTQNRKEEREKKKKKPLTKWVFPRQNFDHV